MRIDPRAQPHEKYFAQVAVGGGAETQITVHNPGSTPITVTLDLIRPDGILSGTEIFGVDPLATTTRSNGEVAGQARAGWLTWPPEGISNRFCSTGFRAVKEDSGPIDPRGVLQQLLETPVQSWRHQGEPEEVRHLGSSAQDSRYSFGLGRDGRHITGVDAGGVLMAALQGLYGILEEQGKEIQALRRELERLSPRVRPEHDPPLEK